MACKRTRRGPAHASTASQVRQRLKQQQEGRLTKAGELVVTSSVTRHQAKNLDDCFIKLQAMVDQACEEPKEREQYEDVSQKNKQQRFADRKRRSEKKKMRRGDVMY